MQIINPNPTDQEKEAALRLLYPENYQKLVDSAASPEVTPGSRAPQKEGEYESKLELAPVERPIAQTIEHPGDMQGVHWFTLGPVYYILKLSHSIINLFQQTPEGENIRYAVMHSGYMYLPDIPGWEDTIEGIQEEHWDLFLRFLGECGFYRNSGEVWTLYGTEIMVPDVSGGSFAITVFTPWGPEFRVVPVWDPTAQVFHFTKEAVGADGRFTDLAHRL